MNNSLVSYIVSALEKAGLTNFRISANENITQLLREDNSIIANIPNNVFIQSLDQKPYTSLKAYVKRSAITGTSKPTNPDQKVDITMNIINMSLTFDATFKTNGAFILQINDNDFLSVNAGDLTDVSDFKLELETKFYKIIGIKNIKLFSWVSAGTGGITLSITQAS